MNRKKASLWKQQGSIGHAFYSISKILLSTTSVVLASRCCAKVQVATINREANLYIRWIEVVQTKIILVISITISSNHDELSIYCTITAVSKVGCYLSTIHRCQPSCPVCLTTRFVACFITSAPAIVVSTKHCLFCISTTEHSQEVVPVASQVAIVCKLDYSSLTKSNLLKLCICWSSPSDSSGQHGPHRV